MKIENIRITPIAVDDPPLRNAAGLHAPYALRTIVELIGDNGVIGLSEVPGSNSTTKALTDSASVLKGFDPFNINKILHELSQHFGAKDKTTFEYDERGRAPWDQRLLVHVFSAIEVACLDLIGKTIDRPVVDLLGGRCRDRVPFSAYLFLKEKGAGGTLGFSTDPSASGWLAERQAAALTPDQIVSQAKSMCASFGFSSIKLKAGTLPPDVEVACMFALYETFGENIPLRIDPNAVWSIETSVKWGQKMDGILEYYEDPTRGQKSMSEVAKRVSMPLATNMCTTSFYDLPGSIQLGSESIILADHHFWGGLRTSVELGRICQTFNRGLSMHSNSHVGISLAAMTHLAAAVPNLTYAVDTHYPWQTDEVIRGGKLEFKDGSLAIPDGPGLGVELDQDALTNLHKKYKDCGLTHRDDQIEMQKIDPEWTFQSTRW